jgi:hypothetical protein
MRELFKKVKEFVKIAGIPTQRCTSRSRRGGTPPMEMV